MGKLLGLQKYLDEFYGNSVFEQALDSGDPWELHLHGHSIVRGRVIENLVYDIKLDIEGRGEEVLPKVRIKLLYPFHLAESIRPLIKSDKKVHALGLEPILAPGGRCFVKNKSLFPLMKDKEVVFLVLLEGEMVRGIITGFSRYDIVVNLKGGHPVTVLRHSIYDIRNKKDRCFLKSFQEERRDWEKSRLFVPEN